MELVQLRYFLKTAETLNYTRAAEELFTSRQALRHALNNLERELGQPLFENDRNRLSLTKYGEYLLLTVGEPVRVFEEKEREIREFFRKPMEVAVAFSESLSPYMLPSLDPVVSEFQKTHPEIVLTARRLSNDGVMEALERGEIDCGCVLQMPREWPGCDSTLLRSSGVALSSGPKSAIYEKRSLTLEELASVPLIGMGSLEKLAKPLWEDCRRRGLTLDYQVVPDTIDAMYLIRNGEVTGFITQLSVPEKLISQHVNSKADLPGYTWEVAALCPKNRPNHAAARLLAEFLKEKYAQ